MDVPFISKSFYNYLEVSSSAFDKALTEKGVPYGVPVFRFFCRLLGLWIMSTGRTCPIKAGLLEL